MKQKIVCAAVLAACLLSAFPTPISAKNPPSVSAGSAVLFEPESGRFLYEKTADTPRPMASTTKLMTALVAAESGDVDRAVTASDAAVRVEGSSMGLHGGDTLSMRDLLTGLLLASGNDAANVCAEAVAGSAEGFAAKMNARAAAIGMNNSHFVTPSGLDAEGHFSTARDMALLAAEVLQNETLAAICATRSATVSTASSKKFYLTNHNKLLSTLQGCIGLKTGYTKASGRCLVSAARRNGVTLIAVTLHAPDDWNDHKLLYDYGFSMLERVTPTADLPEKIPVFGGTAEAIALAPVTLAEMTVMKDETPTVSIDCAPYLWAPVAAGEQVGTVKVLRADGTLAAGYPLIVAESAEVIPPLPRYIQFCRNWRQLVCCLLQ